MQKPSILPTINFQLKEPGLLFDWSSHLTSPGVAFAGFAGVEREAVLVEGREVMMAVLVDRRLLV